MPIRPFRTAACARIGVALSLCALSACLDDSVPAPLATVDGNPSAADSAGPKPVLPAISRDPVPPICPSIGPQALLDSSLAAWHRLEGGLHGDYAYSRLRASPVDSSLDSTRIVFAAGIVAAREIWAMILERPALLFASFDSQGRVVAESLPPARPYRFHACETTDVGGFHYLGDPAVPLDSLYAECAAMMREPGGARVELDADRLLKDCAPATEACRDGGPGCPEEIRIGGIEWRAPPPHCLE